MQERRGKQVGRRNTTLSGKHPVPEIYRRPGFQIRRAHQNSVSVFLEHLKPYDLTPAQYGSLAAVAKWGPISQIDLSRSLGFDRSTTALVVDLLARRKLIAKVSNNADRRKFSLTLTPEGQRILQSSARAAEKARLELLAPFTDEEAAEFLRLLRKFNDAFQQEAGSMAEPAAGKRRKPGRQ